MTLLFTSEEDIKEFDGYNIDVQRDDISGYNIHPCHRLKTLLAPAWYEQDKNPEEMMCCVKDEDIDTTLNDLGFPDQAREYLDRGWNIRFTTIASETIQTLLFNYCGVEF